MPITDFEVGNFPAATREAWLELVEQTLGGKPFSTLTATTLDGIEIQPLYDGDGAGGAEFPELAQEGLAWEVLAFCDLTDGDLATATEIARSEMEGGADGIVLRLEEPVNDEDLKRLISEMLRARAEAGALSEETGFQANQVRLAFDSGPWWQSAAFALARLAEAGGGDLLAGLGLAEVSKADSAGGSETASGSSETASETDGSGSAEFVSKPVGLQVSLRADPIAALARYGTMGEGSLTDLVVKKPEALRHVRTVGVDASVFSDAGASEAQEVACSLAAGVWHLRELAEAGVSIDAACTEMEFTYAATADQFATIAKLRAARQCWHRIAEASGASPEARRQRQHAVTSRSMLTRYDPMVNVLRSTVAAFAAGVAGVDSQCVLPYDTAIGAPSESSRRLARNISHILTQESRIGHVADPARGSAYVAELTRSIAERAWELFQEIEAKDGTGINSREGNGIREERRKGGGAGVSGARNGAGESGTERGDTKEGGNRGGGIVAALEDGTIGRWLEDSWQKRAERIACRKDPICGVSEFPVQGEAAPSRAGWTINNPNALLPIRRLSEPFENLRDAVDASGAEPKVFLASLSSLAEDSARLAFTENLLAAGGISSQVGSVTEFAGQDFTMAVLCSSDKVYAEQAHAATATLRAAGCQWVYLAGRPKGDLAEIAKAAGIDGTLYAGCDAVALLEEMLERLGVAVK